MHWKTKGAQLSLGLVPSDNKLLQETVLTQIYGDIRVGSWRCRCLLTWFCYQLMTKTPHATHSGLTFFWGGWGDVVLNFTWLCFILLFYFVGPSSTVTEIEINPWPGAANSLAGFRQCWQNNLTEKTGLGRRQSYYAYTGGSEGISIFGLTH